MRWRLIVTYPTGFDAYPWGSLDAPIVEAVGKLDTGRGTALESGTRELEFSFSSEQAARNARQRVLNLHKKGVRTHVRPA